MLNGTLLPPAVLKTPLVPRASELFHSPHSLGTIPAGTALLSCIAGYRECRLPRCTRQLATTRQIMQMLRGIHRNDYDDIC